MDDFFSCSQALDHTPVRWKGTGVKGIRSDNSLRSSLLHFTVSENQLDMLWYDWTFWDC